MAGAESNAGRKNGRSEPGTGEGRKEWMTVELVKEERNGWRED